MEEFNYYRIGSNEHGRAIYATRFIPKDSIVMRGPLLKFTKEETELLQNTLLAHYIFNWNTDCSCIPLGCCALMNHSNHPNVGWDESGEQEFLFTALRDIKPGEELMLDYGYTPDSYQDSGVEEMLTRRSLAKVLSHVEAAAYRRLTANSIVSVQAAIRDYLNDRLATRAQILKAIKQINPELVKDFDAAWQDLLDQEYLVPAGNQYYWED